MPASQGYRVWRLTVQQGDIVRRLRRWVHDVHAVSASDLMDEAANVIESLRLEIAALREEQRPDRIR